MEPHPNNSNTNGNAQQQQQHYQQHTQQNTFYANNTYGHELRSYFLQQGQSAGRLCGILYSNVLAFGFKTFLSVLLQILCYVLFAFALYVALTFPSDLPALLAYMSHQSFLNALPLHDFEEVNGFLFFIKIFIVILAMPALICGILLGRNRRKSKRIRSAYKEAELMKSNFDKALQYFRF